LNKSLTIALPMHNGETRLRKCVHELLYLASELTDDFSLLIIDDGSTDDTFDVAQELAARYPQISVERHRVRRGLGPTIEAIERRERADVVIVHDGTSSIDVAQVRRLWQRSAAPSWEVHGDHSAGEDSGRWDRGELADLPSIHDAMADAHQRLLGFHLLRPIRSDEALMHVGAAAPAACSGPKGKLPVDSSDVGRIPSLPRPKFLSTLVEFAFGE
jgi:glycosyltransferase involved in cell wall biosynthesis